MARTKGSKDYPLETKLAAIRLYEAGMTYAEIARKLSLTDPRRTSSWLRIYRREGEAGLKKPRPGRPKKDRNSLEERIKQLEMENTLLKALALELGEELPAGLDTEPSTDPEGNST